ncbi:MAG: VirB3 family type IV secretion system protein [Synergistaceae bacterium]|jgi:type IV secretory pathway TrbD component|nr:VirB3 family type IV secretion system protein [Synergistaceae bacterium]
MDDLKRVPVHRGLTRQQLLAGCDRELFLLLAMLCGLLLMSGITRMYWRNIFLGIGLWLVGVPILARLAIYDPHFKGVVVRGIRYTRISLPAVGKPGSRVKLVHHKGSWAP